jgi:hypothetical protein
MADALPIPDDLVQFQKQLDAGTAELDAYTHAMALEYCERYPEPGQFLERTRWTEEDLAESQRLCEAVRELLTAVHAHPTMEQARALGVAWPTWKALTKTAREQGAAA